MNFLLHAIFKFCTTKRLFKFKTIGITGSVLVSLKRAPPFLEFGSDVTLFRTVDISLRENVSLQRTLIRFCWRNP